MTYKSLLIAGAISICAVSAKAQDRIYLDDGTMIEGKVKEINQRSIIYRRWDNQEGADYVLTRKEVERIVYQNGSEERLLNRGQRPSPFSRGRDDRDEARDDRRAQPRRSGMDPQYGRNIIAFAPIQMTNESAAGFGLHYERILDKDGIFALYLPVAIALYDDFGNVSTPSGTMTVQKARTFTYFYPGAKFYPGGSGRRASYSVGPSFGFGFGTKYRTSQTYNPATGSYFVNFSEDNVFKAGFMVNNGLNIQPTKALYVGLELGIGIQYYNNESNESYVVGDEPMVQFNFKMGYRF